jgi:hypothetical protein
MLWTLTFCRENAHWQTIFEDDETACDSRYARAGQNHAAKI